MKNQKNLINIMLGLLTLVLIFHFLIMIGLIPYEISWGGRLKNENEMYVFETISILINLFLGWILLMKARIVAFRFRPKIVHFVLWFFLALFILNTIGNIFASTTIEQLFSGLTLLFAVLIWRILRVKNEENIHFDVKNRA